MKIGVTGPGGQLGRELIRQGCVPLKGRLLSEQLRYNIEATKPDAIINCAAMTDVDGCETQLMQAAATNAGGVTWLSEIYRGYLIQVSTDYIFDGRSGPYGIKDAPNPISVYGWSKLGGELAAQRHRGPSLVVRTTVLFSETQNNFVFKVADCLQSYGQLCLYSHDLFGTPTYVPALAAEMIRVVREGYTGVAHIAGNRTMTRLDLARLIAAVLGLDQSMITPIDESRSGAPRPVRAGLICDHSGYRVINSHDITDGLKELASKGVFDERTMEGMATG